MQPSGIRQAAWSGQFYPQNPEDLRTMISIFLDNSPDEQITQRIVGIIAPHAGYEYSGRIAAKVYKQIANKPYHTVIVLAPSHTELIDGVSVYNGTHYKTPLGMVEVNRELATDICDYSEYLHLSEIGHSKYIQRPEHSLEVQLPFLQSVLPGPFTIVPIVFHDYSWNTCFELGTAIAQAIKTDQSVLLVASTDLYHGSSYQECQLADTETIKAIEAFDPRAFINGIHESRYQACGAGPVAAMQVAAFEAGAAKVQILDRTSSADITGVRDGWTVGYTCALITE